MSIEHADLKKEKQQQAAQPIMHNPMEIQKSSIDEAVAEERRQNSANQLNKEEIGRQIEKIRKQLNSDASNLQRGMEMLKDQEKFEKAFAEADELNSYDIAMRKLNLELMAKNIESMKKFEDRKEENKEKEKQVESFKKELAKAEQEGREILHVVTDEEIAESVDTSRGLEDALQDLEIDLRDRGGSKSYKNVITELRAFNEIKDQKIDSHEGNIERRSKYFRAVEAVDRYLESHKSPRWTQKGKNRVEMMTKLKKTLEDTRHDTELVYSEAEISLDKDMMELSAQDYEAEMTKPGNYEAIARGCYNCFQADAAIASMYESGSSCVKKSHMDVVDNIMMSLNIDAGDLAMETKEEQERITQIRTQMMRIYTKVIKGLGEVVRKYQSEAPEGVDPENYGLYMARFTQMGINCNAYDIMKAASLENGFSHVEAVKDMQRASAQFEEDNRLYGKFSNESKQIEETIPEQYRKKENEVEKAVLDAYIKKGIIEVHPDSEE